MWKTEKNKSSLKQQHLSLTCQDSGYLSEVPTGQITL